LLYIGLLNRCFYLTFQRSSKGQVGSLYMDYHVFKKPKIKDGKKIYQQHCIRDIE